MSQAGILLFYQQRLAASRVEKVGGQEIAIFRQILRIFDNSDQTATNFQQSKIMSAHGLNFAPKFHKNVCFLAPSLLFRPQVSTKRFSANSDRLNSIIYASSATTPLAMSEYA